MRKLGLHQIAEYIVAFTFLGFGLIFFGLALHALKTGEVYVMAKDHVSIFDARLYTRHDTPKQFSDAVNCYFIGGSIVTLFSVRQFRGIWKESHRNTR